MSAKLKLRVDVGGALTLMVPIAPDATVQQLLDAVAKRAAKKMGAPTGWCFCAPFDPDDSRPAASSVHPSGRKGAAGL